MARLAIVGLILAFGAAEAQEAATGRVYQVAFWYELDRPTTSVRSRVYDVDRGEYDARAVGRWLDTILAQYPSHGAYVREITTRGEPGATEPERLANALRRESQRWADLQRQPSKPLPKVFGPSAGPRKSRPMNNARPSPSFSTEIPAPIPSPIPYPYRSRTP